MKKNKLAGIILLNEMRKAYGRKRTLILLCMIPAIVVILFSILMHASLERRENYSIVVYCDDEVNLEKLRRAKPGKEKLFFSEERYDENEIYKGNVTVAIRVEDDISITYSGENITNAVAVLEAEKLAYEFAMILADEKVYAENINARRDIAYLLKFFNSSP